MGYQGVRGRVRGVAGENDFTRALSIKDVQGYRAPA
jgi:hypothetical protein